jgi:hypothetical protein
VFLYVNTGTAVPANEFNILLLHSSTALSEFALFCMVQSETYFTKKNTLVILHYLVLGVDGNNICWIVYSINVFQSYINVVFVTLLVILQNSKTVWH